MLLVCAAGLVDNPRITEDSEMFVLKHVLSLLVVVTVAAALPRAASADPNPAQSAPQNSPLSPAQVRAVEQIIHDYLVNNPQVILDAVEKLEQQHQDQEQAAAKSAISGHRDELFHDPTSGVAGNPNGNVTIVEFFDYRCPYCKQVEPSLEQLLKDDRQIRFIYKEFPILGPDSVIASHAALAARKQNKYLPLHDALMRAHGQLDEAAILKIAADVGIDVSRLKSDMDSPEINQIISKNMDLAHALNITGTPGFIVGDQLVPGAVDLSTLKKLVAEARK